MKRRDLDYVVITLLVGSSIYVFATGLVADTMGLHHFGLHSQVGYLWMSLAVMHLIQTWVRVKAFARNRFRPAKSSLATHSALGAQGFAPAPLPNAPESTAQVPKPSAHPPFGKKRRYFLLAILAIATGIGFDRLVTPSDSASLADVDNDVGLLYHRWSQPGYGEAIATILNWGQQPPLYKTYPDSPPLDLPPPALEGVSTQDLTATILKRRSHRNYNASKALPLLQLSQVLHLAQGITDENRDFRTVPSSGALYPLEIYAIVHRVEGLEPGLYHHAIQHHQLELVKAGDLRQPLIKAGLSQDFLGEAQVCFVVSGIFQRTRWKYHERTYRYVLMEAGHLGQNLYLAATALNLGVCGIGAFFDDSLNELLNLDGQTEAAVYLVTVGERA
ncbi:MAG: SagB/ThcOx family dehydrogenase [Cyanobacteria bacterium]|nr:SagB/ThcOx family dehydrogenase [Cyanobacteriota bacterium]MDA0867525.1 SagB/ThcOx family dehydrogenase [Cyanobacteriota bacterium]